MAERHITVYRRMSASAGYVWVLYADFPNLAKHWDGSGQRAASASRPASAEPAPGLASNVTHARRKDAPVQVASRWAAVMRAADPPIDRSAHRQWSHSRRPAYVGGSIST